MTYVFRVDSSTIIGSGHLMRCLTLASKLKKYDDVQIHFISRDLDGNLTNLIIKSGHILHLLPKVEYQENLQGYAKWLTVSQKYDAKETIDIIKIIGMVNQIIIDSYAIDITWEKMIRPFVKEIYVIDDLANRHHDCDYLLDQNSYINKELRYEGLVPNTCKLILGYEHALIRDEFYEAKKTMHKRDGIVRNILVFYGGSDLTNETMKALLAIEKLGINNIIINVIVGNSNIHKEQVKEFCTKYYNMHYFCQVNNMAEFMAKADLAIGAGGSTTWERIFMKLPAIVTSIADNQKQIGEACSKEKYIDYLGMYDTVNVDDIINALKKYIGK